MSVFKRVFDLRHVYARLIVVFTLTILSVMGWWAIRQNVATRKQAFVDQEVSKIEAALAARLHTVTLTLRRIRSYINRVQMRGRQPEMKDFDNFISELQIDKYLPGVGAVGFAELVRAEDLGRFESEMVRMYPNFRPFPKGNRSFYIFLRYFWPNSVRQANVIGFDLASDDVRLAAIRRAVEADEVQLTPPLFFQSKFKDSARYGVIAFLPIYKATAAGVKPDLETDVSGLINMTLHSRDFVESALGAPDVQNEKLQFSIVVTDDESEKVLYSRFDIPADDTLSEPVTVREGFSPAFTNWAIHARPLPKAFSPWLSNLHHIFLAIAGLLICSIWWSLSSTASEMLAEETSRRQLIDSERRVKEYSRTLLKLNLSIRNVLSEISLEKILPAVTENIRDGLRAGLSAVYLREEIDDLDQGGQVRFRLRHQVGATDRYELIDTATLQNIWEFSNLRDVLYWSQGGEHFSNTSLFVKKGRYQSVVILPFIDQTESVVGFALSLSEREFADDEFIDSFLTGLVKPIGVALRNSYLFTKANEAVQSKTAFLANMSHEIRTPLGAIVGFSDLLCQDGLDTSYREEIKKNIHRNTGLLTRIIDDILDFSKFELSQPVLSFKTVPLSTLITEVQSVVHMLAQEKGIALRFEFVNGLPDVIETDDVRIKQVLLNLIGNAIKFTDKGHVVVEVSFDSKTKLLRFRVIDTGSGISDEARQRLFQPFSQGDDTNTRKYGGTGLGLVLSRKLAQALGGQVRLVNSVVGQGSVFEFVIPIHAPEATEEVGGLLSSNEEVTDISNKLAGRRILLVEDSVDNQEIFSLFLQRAGATVDLAKSGDEALIKAASQNYDIILMDIQLPIVDGKQATRILRRRGWNKPIIALTAHALEEERAAVLDAGCDGQITKPVTGNHLVMAVHKFLEVSEARVRV